MRPSCLVTSRAARAAAFAISLVGALGISRPASALIVITEIMYHPAGGGRDLEYIELHNETGEPVDLTGWSFVEGVQFAFTTRTFLEGGQYIVVCANAEAVRQKYAISNAVGNFDPATSLDNGGERISLANPGGSIECSVEYNDRGRWPSAADGTGHSLEIVSPYAPVDDADSWSASGVKDGSPGKANGVAVGAVPVRVNEALLLPDSGDRWVELYNPSQDPVDLSGYLISTDRLGARKAILPAETSVPGRGWLSFTDTALGLDFAPVASPGEPGDPPQPLRTFIALWSPDGSRVIDARVFQPNASLSEARIPDGGSYFSESAKPTRDAANQVEVESGIVIHEILYHPIDRDDRREFIELYNRSDRTIDIGGWSFISGVNFTFPSPTNVAPGSYLVVARHPDFIRDTYGLPADRVLGPADEEARAAFGILRDRGERVRLLDARGNIADEVRYADGGEWPRWADGGGSSLELIDPRQDNSAAQAWDASDDSAASVARQYSYLGVFNGAPTGDTAEMHIVVPGGGISLIDDFSINTEETTVEVLDTFFTYEDSFKYFKGTQEPSDPIEAWRQADFDDSAWLVGPGPIGYGESASGEGTTLDDMRGSYVSFYVRKEFTIPDPSALTNLILEVEYDDGFAAHLNGVEVAAVNMKPERTFDTTAPRGVERAKASVDLTERVEELVRAGRNVLAVQVHNQTLTNVDARFKARLVNGRYVTTTGPNLLRDGTWETDASRTSWVYDGTHIRSGRSPREPIAGAGSLKVVSTGGGDNKVNRIETSGTGLLAQPAVGTTYRVSFQARWIVGSPTVLTHGANTVSGPANYASSTQLDIPPRLGTPGAVNGVSLRQEARVGSVNLGPVIRDVSHSPAMPRASEAVAVRARVTDPDGVSEVVLHYSLQTPKAPGAAGHVEVPMTGPDADGLWSAQIPGQASATKVVWYIAAKDAGGRTGRFPIDVRERTHPLALDPEAVPMNDEKYAIYRHDTAVGGKVPSYRLWMHQANEAYVSSRKLLSNDYVDSTFYFNDREVYYNTQMRFAGSPWARQAWTESYRVKMPKDKPLHGYIRTFNLEDHQGAGARDGRDRITNYLICQNQGSIKVPYMNHWLAQWQVNDRVKEVREHVTVPNREFLDRWYPGEDDGDFFEMDDRFVINDAGARVDSLQGNLRYPPYGTVDRGTDKEEYRYFLNIRSYRELDDHTGLIALAKLMTPTATPDPEFDARIWSEVDVEEFCRIWSIRFNIGDWDTWGTERGKNCYLYRPTIDGRWALFQWDSELTYESGREGSFAPPNLTAASNPQYVPGGAFTEVTRFINRVPTKRLYYGILKEMIDHQFNSQYLTPYMTLLARAGVQSTNVGTANGWIDRRKAILVSAVRGVSSPTVKLEVTTNGGNPIQTPSSPVTIEGNAPVEVRFLAVVVNGRVSEEWTSEFSAAKVVGWSATGPLPDGKSTIEILGFDGKSEFFDSTSIEVTVSSQPRPEIASILPSEVEAGGQVTITGSSFAVGLRVLFDGVDAAQVLFDPEVDPGTIVATVPAEAEIGPSEVRVVNPSGLESDPREITIVAAPPRFIRGDGDSDGQVSITDAIVALNFLFLGGAEPACMDAADADDDEKVNLTDPIIVLEHLFKGGFAPAPPYPEAGVDPTPEPTLGCALGL